MDAPVEEDALQPSTYPPWKKPSAFWLAEKGGRSMVGRYPTPRECREQGKQEVFVCSLLARTGSDCTSSRKTSNSSEKLNGRRTKEGVDQLKKDRAKIGEGTAFVKHWRDTAIVNEMVKGKPKINCRANEM